LNGPRMFLTYPDICAPLVPGRPVAPRVTPGAHCSDRGSGGVRSRPHRGTRRSRCRPQALRCTRIHHPHAPQSNRTQVGPSGSNPGDRVLPVVLYTTAGVLNTQGPAIRLTLLSSQAFGMCSSSSRVRQMRNLAPRGRPAAARARRKYAAPRS
jgi:hypothetical protein